MIVGQRIRRPDAADKVKGTALYVEDLPSLPLYFRLSLSTSIKALRNVKPTGLGSFYINWNSQEWSY